MTKASDNEFPSVLLEEQGAAPTTPASGFWRVYAKSTGLFVVDDAGSETGPFGAGGGSGDAPEELNYTEKTSSTTITATSAASADTVITAGAVSMDGSTVIDIEFYAAAVRPRADAAGTLTVVLYDGSTQLGNLAQFQSADAVNDNKPCYVRRRLTPSNASHTYSIRAHVGSGSGNISAGDGAAGNQMPAFIRIVTVP